jgi:hypothetical protein
MGLVLGTVDTGAPSWSDSSGGRGGQGVTNTVESGSTAVPAAQQPEAAQQEQGLGSAVETGCRSTLVVSGRPRRILVAALGTGMGTTTIAALLGPVLATTRAGTVRILDATPHPGALAARLRSSPASTGVDGAARLEVRTVDPAAVCAAEQPAGDDVTVVDVGAELAAAARSGLFGWADRLVFVRCDSGEAGPGQAMPRAIPVDALVAAGYKALAQHAVTVSIAHDPPATPAEPAPCLSVDGSRAGRRAHPVRCPPRHGWRPRPRPAVPGHRRGGPPARHARHRIVQPRPRIEAAMRVERHAELL